MENPLIRFCFDLAKTVRLADLLDIALISFFIYSAIIWFKRTTSRLMVMGVLVLTLLYFLARKLDLYLTSLLFQTIFAVSLVALVVIFQEEIRRGFERVALWGTLRERRGGVVGPWMDTLLEAVNTLANQRIGALIVIRGREPIDRHVEGGIPLFGRISLPLICSLFDPHSPGHDGAMLIEGDRVSKFGVHLPLSRNLSEVGTLGTRHAAALGISERTDCFAVVVSEERGAITVAEDGRLERIGSVAHLKNRLERFYLNRFPQVSDRFSEFRRLLRENARIKVLSIALACLAWFVLAHRTETIQRTFAVPLEYRNLPPGWAIEGEKPAEVMVTLSGSERAFHLLNPANLLVSVDLSKVREGVQRFPLSEEDLKRPANLQIYRIEPNTIAIQAYPVGVVNLPVEIQTTGQLPPSLVLVGLKAVPPTVRAQVRQAFLKETIKVLTEPILLSSITQTSWVTVKLNLPEYVRLLEPALPEIKVMVEVRPKGE
jgi:diadenylate cyclase